MENKIYFDWCVGAKVMPQYNKLKMGEDYVVKKINNKFK